MPLYHNDALLIVEQLQFYRDHIRARSLEIADVFLSDPKHTVRSVAKKNHLSKSSIHLALTKVLPLVDLDRSKDVAAQLDKNLSERHIRGGESTKSKYDLIKERQLEDQEYYRNR